jgi:hypothetical protein
MNIVKGDIGLTALPPEIDCNQTAKGFPPVTSAEYLIAKSLVKRRRLRGISEMPLLYTPSGIKRVWYEKKENV